LEEIVMFGRYWKVAPFHFGYHPHPLSKFLSNKILNPLRSKPVRKLQQKNIVPLLIEVERIILVFWMAIIEGAIALACPHQEKC
jgi:hypothetical protein